MDNIIQSIKYKGCNINLYYDNNPIAPDEYLDDDIILLSQNRNFSLSRNGFDIDDVYKYYINNEDYKGYNIYPISLYVHSGVALSIGEKSGWDISFSAFLLIRNIDNPDKYAENYIEQWNKYLSGQVYLCTIDDVYSCGNWYEEDDAIDDAKSIIDAWYDSYIIDHTNYLKSVIKKGVFIIYRKPFKFEFSKIFKDN